MRSERGPARERASAMPSFRFPRSARRPRLAATALALATFAGAAALHQPTAASAGAVVMSEPFRVATFNILGASHTENGQKGFETYEARMRRTVQLINEKAFDIVGFQEYQLPQHELFLKLTQGSWGVYPGLQAGRRPLANSIVWRTDEWTIVEKGLYTIPYFRGKLVQQPFIKLRHKQGGQEVWVINTHNPADSKGPAEQYRERAEQIQVELANRLEATGLPVFLVGDFNEREDAFCAITGGTNLKAANGGGRVGDSCRPPSRMRIDWIFLSKAAQVDSYTDLDTAFVRSITDHKVIFSDVSVPN